MFPKFNGLAWLDQFGSLLSDRFKLRNSVSGRRFRRRVRADRGARCQRGTELEGDAPPLHAPLLRFRVYRLQCDYDGSRRWRRYGELLLSARNDEDAQQAVCNFRSF